MLPAFCHLGELQENQNLFDKYPHILTGVFEEAERKVLIIGEEDETNVDLYLTIISITSNEKLEHRQVLGSILGTGIKREVVGDIIIKENVANVVVLKDISRYIIQNLDKVGREKVKVKAISQDDILEVEKKYKEIKTTVASLRLDAVISACFGLSREVSSKLVEGEKVNLNYKLTTNPSKHIAEGDLISVRGYGRFEVAEKLGSTRKDRIRVVFKINVS